MKKVESSCCKKYRKKGKACSNCPLMKRLDRKQRKALVSKARHKKAGKKKK